MPNTDDDDDDGAPTTSCDGVDAIGGVNCLLEWACMYIAAAREPKDLDSDGIGLGFGFGFSPAVAKTAARVL